MAEEQKPLHVVSKKSVVPNSPLEAHILEQGQKDAEAKADELALHFPQGMQFYVTAEQDDESISYYLNFKLEF